MIKDLYTIGDVKEERRRLYDKQNGIDPILKTEIPFNETVCDHDHTAQNTRAALHRQTNVFEGRVVNAYTRGLKWLTDLPLPAILRNLAAYLEEDYSQNPHHPGWIKRVTIDFKKLKVQGQVNVLKQLGQENVKPTNRVPAFTKAIQSKQFGYLVVKSLIEKEKE